MGPHQDEPDSEGGSSNLVHGGGVSQPRAPGRFKQFRGEGSGVRHPSRPGVPCGAGGVSHSVQWDVGCGVRRCNPFLRAAEHVGEETDPSVRAERQARPLLRPARPDAPGVFRGRDASDLARNGPRRACGPGARRASPHQLWGSTECCTASGSASGCSVATPASTGKSPRLLWPRREERWGRPTPASDLLERRREVMEAWAAYVASVRSSG